MNYSKLRNKCFSICYSFLDSKSGCQYRKCYKFRNSTQLQKFIQRILNNDDFFVYSIYVSIYGKDEFDNLCDPEHSEV